MLALRHPEPAAIAAPCRHNAFRRSGPDLSAPTTPPHFSAPRRLNEAPRVAVLVRTHLANEKLFHLLGVLRQSSRYDLFVVADETNGALDVGGYRKLSHSAASCAVFGLPADHHRILWHCGDYPFYFAAAEIPDYDYYLMIEFDVDLVGQSPAFVETLISRFAHHDLISEHFRRPEPGWPWFEAASAVYETVYTAGLFAFLAISRNAVEFLLQARRAEAQRGSKGADIIHCEAHCASALAAAGFSCVSINNLIPGATDRRCFHDPDFDLETSFYLLNQYQLPIPNTALVHPVYDLAAYLKKNWQKSLHTGNIQAFIAELQQIIPPDPAAERLLSDFRKAAASADLPDIGHAGGPVPCLVPSPRH